MAVPNSALRSVHVLKLLLKFVRAARLQIEVGTKEFFELRRNISQKNALRISRSFQAIYFVGPKRSHQSSRQISCKISLQKHNSPTSLCRRAGRTVRKTYHPPDMYPPVDHAGLVAYIQHHLEHALKRPCCGKDSTKKFRPELSSTMLFTAKFRSFWTEGALTTKYTANFPRRRE